MKKAQIALGIAVLLVSALRLRAQTGCTDSPEDPTVVLALVSGTGALAASVWRFRNKLGPPRK
jgi:XrtJ-associated TM-motif-TM protein